MLRFAYVLFTLSALPAILSLKIVDPRWSVTGEKNKTIYITLISYLSDPLLMEMKSYCASKGFLDTAYLTKYEVKNLPKIALPDDPEDIIAVVPGSLQGDWKMEKGKSIELPGAFDDSCSERMNFLSQSALLLKNFNGYAVSFNYWIDDEATPIWKNFSWTQHQYFRTVENIDGEEIMERTAAARVAEKTSNWPITDARITPERYTVIQDWLVKRGLDIANNKDHMIYIPQLEDLFYKDKMSTMLFTEDVLYFFNETHPYLDLKDVFDLATFKILGCAEERRTTIVTSIILAVKITVPEYAVYQYKGENDDYNKSTSNVYSRIIDLLAF